MNYVFVINPVAGKGNQANNIVHQIHSFFERRKDTIHVYLSKCAGDAIRFGREFPIAKKEEVCFVACGGDGTFFEVVNGAFGRPGASFAVYPCGSGNDFIKTTGGTQEDYLDLNKLVNGEIKIFDVIDVNGNICSNICNIGMDSIACDKANGYNNLPFVSGPMAYNLSVFVTLCGYIFKKGSFPMKITFDDGEVLDGHFMLSVFGNGQVYGGGYHPVPNAKLDDGFMDFCSVNETSVARFSKFIGTYKAGNHYNNPNFADLLTMRRCISAHIESPVELTVCTDGEIFKSKTVKLRVIPASLPFRLPAFDL